MNSRAKRVLLCLFLWARVSYLLAQGGNEIRIDTIAPRVVNDSLMVSASFHNLFSKKIIGTIQSGLPSIVNVEVKLIEGENNQIVHRLISRSISFDIWQERYAVATANRVRTFTNFENVKHVSSQLDNVFLVPDTLLKIQKQYNVRMRVAIIPISSRQGAKVDDWLIDPNQTEERLASEDRSSGFKFTLSNLVSFFVRDRRQSRYNSEWFSSKPFTSNTLK